MLLSLEIPVSISNPVSQLWNYRPKHNKCECSQRYKVEKSGLGLGFYSPPLTAIENPWGLSLGVICIKRLFLIPDIPQETKAFLILFSSVSYKPLFSFPLSLFFSTSPFFIPFHFQCKLDLCQLLPPDTPLSRAAPKNMKHGGNTPFLLQWCDRPISFSIMSSRFICQH